MRVSGLQGFSIFADWLKRQIPMLVTLSQHPAANLCKFHRPVTEEAGAQHGAPRSFVTDLNSLFTITYKQRRKGGSENGRFYEAFFAADGSFFSTTISTESGVQISLFLTDLGGNSGGPAKIMRNVRRLSVEITA
jgi:hypothetical protein